jgi:hypothetical protein
MRAFTNGSCGVLERRQISATGRSWAVDPATGSLTEGEGRPSAYGSSLLTGHHWDPYTQWHCARHRWISPWTYARFTSDSPLTYPVAELNYEWVLRNPWDWVDLDGLEAVEATMDFQWHHLLPQEFSPQANRVGIKVNSAPNGIFMPMADHQALHQAGWNDDWRDFFRRNPNASKCEIEDFLKKLKRKRKYKYLLHRGTQANMSYWVWKSISNKAVKLLLRGWTRVGDKIVPASTYASVMYMVLHGQIREANAAYWQNTYIGTVAMETGNFPGYLDCLTDMPTYSTVQGGYGSGWNYDVGYRLFVNP